MSPSSRNSFSLYRRVIIWLFGYDYFISYSHDDVGDYVQDLHRQLSHTHFQRGSVTPNCVGNLTVAETRFERHGYPFRFTFSKMTSHRWDSFRAAVFEQPTSRTSSGDFSKINSSTIAFQM